MKDPDPASPSNGSTGGAFPLRVAGFSTGFEPDAPDSTPLVTGNGELLPVPTEIRGSSLLGMLSNTPSLKLVDVAFSLS